MDTPPATPQPSFDAAGITRPDAALLKYYVIVAALTVAGWPP